MNLLYGSWFMFHCIISYKCACEKPCDDDYAGLIYD